VRVIGMSKLSVTALSERNAPTPSGSVEFPIGTIGDNGADRFAGNDGDVTAATGAAAATGDAFAAESALTVTGAGVAGV
jgi:hypothetical protein